MTDREKLIALLGAEVCHRECDDCEYQGSTDACLAFVKERTADHLLANGVVVREKGEWVAVEESKDSGRFPMQRKCSCCGKRQLWMNAVTYNFCPNCGADMRKGENG